LNRKRLQWSGATVLPVLLWVDVASCELDADEVKEAREGIEADVEFEVMDIGREWDRCRDIGDDARG